VLVVLQQVKIVLSPGEHMRDLVDGSRRQTQGEVGVLRGVDQRLLFPRDDVVPHGTQKPEHGLAEPAHAFGKVYATWQRTRDVMDIRA
jgi:hypothetical protein